MQSQNFLNITMTEELVAGVDEVGRGPLAGEVYAAAVILDDRRPIEGLMDSKKLNEKRRSELSDEIKQNSLAWSISFSTVDEIDEINILNATLLAMKRAIEALQIQPYNVLVDGIHSPAVDHVDVNTVIKGDEKHGCISAASIIAKVERDRRMLVLDKSYPEWGFAKHKGYGTKAHLAALREHGISPLHRRSFEPIKTMVRRMTI